MFHPIPQSSCVMHPPARRTPKELNAASRRLTKAKDLQKRWKVDELESPELAKTAAGRAVKEIAPRIEKLEAELKEAIRQLEEKNEEKNKESQSASDS